MTKPLVSEVKQRLISLGGQAVRASRDDNNRAPYVLNLRDTTNCLTLSQKLIGAKENEITHATEVIKSLEIHGAVVITDALNTQKKFASQIINQGADYILALRNNHARLYEYVKGLFEMNAKAMIKGAPQIELGHGIIETRSIRILAGSKLPETMHKHWIGLEEGYLIEVRKEIEIKKTSQRSVEFRYYFSSIPFEDYDVDKQKSLLNLFENYIRQHWSIENNTHWMLDVVFNQDRLQTVNPEYLQGLTSLTKIGLNTLEKYRKILKDENLSISSMRVMMSNIDKVIDCLEKVYSQKSDF